MHLNFSQQMKMSQQMKLAPRMIQSMEILQMSVMALQEKIDQELEENVVLESVDPRQKEVHESEAPEQLNGKEIDRQEITVDSDHNNQADFERLLEMSADWPEDNFTSGGKPSANRIDEFSDRQHDLMGNLEAHPQSLQDYLLEQFPYLNCDTEEREFGEFLIQNLDEQGRLQGTLAEIVQVFGKPVERELAEKVLSMIQKLDPPGVGARNLQECLLLQIDEETPMRDILITLVTDHLENISQNRLPLIERQTGYSLETIKDALEQLRTLEPFPGRRFISHVSQNVTPDVKVELGSDGQWTVQLINDYTPELRISRKYMKMLAANPDQKTKDYIRKKIESAKWLIESIEQRHNTLKKVAQAIVDHQSDFLESGPEAIVPLKMQQVADDVGVHVTTVSRAVDGKYMETPRGIYPLRRFFGGGTTTADGDEVAWQKIRLKLQEVIDAEDKSNPLSDDALVKEMANHGYTLARRTITKYRKAMNIPSSRQRKVY
ncbi:MAG: RNA polymerase sigma-54 factor [Planctomyces sp.]|uniref:RNA polymerase factor sigma-54 n=1 Tax=Rubinisphaera sp. JC750 TaxID=2898658 RepID=UPI000C57DB9F|nr:RNA polymerase factor sigma-54 [Rubinisphaera sp. JC750]MBB01129.1 RNA polymerase sigma-54 factor [Planctomyces sp.]